MFFGESRSLPCPAVHPNVFFPPVIKRTQMERRFWKIPGGRGSRFSALTSFLLLAVALTAAEPKDSAFRPLDLSSFYNSSLADVTGFPRGTQILGGAPFLIGGKAEVTGLDAAS